MKTKFLFAGLLLAGGLFTVNAQTNTATSTITSRGLEAGTLGTGNAFFGYRAGKANSSTGNSNTFIGNNSGINTTSGIHNVFLGHNSGSYNITGNYNTCIGSASGNDSPAGIGNTFLGFASGAANTGNYNIYLGSNTGADSQGSNNIYIGNDAGNEKTGSNNIYIGTSIGTSSSNKLMIDNTSTSTPLIWGDFALDQLKLNGTVGIGGVTTFPTTAGTVNVSAYKLFVKGGILTEEVRVSLQNTWADYVFNKEYKLKPLQEVEQFITDNGHLPNVPSAAQVKQDGIELGDMARIQQEKIEELTLYLIEQNKRIEKQDKELEELKAAVKALSNKQ